MPARFLTAEDVRRAGGPEIVLDESTVVTPQAQEAADSLGIRLRTSAGDYQAPPPDRGPDATAAAAHRPLLPEPESGLGAGDGTGVVITAAGRNRPGVLAEITSHLGKAGANIHDISQKMVEGYFHMILTVELPQGASFADLKAQMQCLGGPDDFVVRVMHERVFRYMHRV